MTLLSPNQCVLYTWDEPSAERTIMWNVYGRKKPSYPAFINKVQWTLRDVARVFHTVLPLRGTVDAVMKFGIVLILYDAPRPV